MVHEELLARLNDAGYKNWLKAGYCLLKVRDGLCGFADYEMQIFHSILISNNVALHRGQTCRSNCRPRGNQFQSACPVCNEWRKEILRHHTKPSGVINWGNCRPWLWPSEPWELAKAFMPRGLADANGAEHCDAAALLNLLHFCDHFSFINPVLVTEVIHCRNELMHSCKMQVSDQWMAHFQKRLQQLLLQLSHIPAMDAASQQIQEMLSVDLSVHVPGEDIVDGEGIESISQWELELLRDCLKNLDEHEDLKEMQTLHTLLTAHNDLEEQFQAELQVLQEQLQRGIKK